MISVWADCSIIWDHRQNINQVRQKNKQKNKKKTSAKVMKRAIPKRHAIVNTCYNLEIQSDFVQSLSKTYH